MKRTLNSIKEINSWVLFLSRKGIKEFTLINDRMPLELHSHLLSCQELTHLKLHDCSVCFVPSFCGFSNPLSLDLSSSHIFGEYICRKFISRCLLLESLKLSFGTTYEIKRTEIAKLKNLKALSLPWCNLDKAVMITRRNRRVLSHWRVIRRTSMLQFIGSFPKLQELDLNFKYCKRF